jgi:tRNA 2-thiouridine synthesizing protein A
MTEPHPTPDDVAPDAGAVATIVDATGKGCPLPVIELAQAVNDVAVGAQVRLLATDPAAKVDVPVWCRMQRHDLLVQREEDGVWRFEVRRAH